MNKNVYRELLLSLLCFLTAGGCYAKEYDIVINNGRVMDPETEFDGIRNVGIEDRKIAKITKSTIKGKETIDATGLVVAPGVCQQYSVDCRSRERARRGGKPGAACMEPSRR